MGGQPGSGCCALAGGCIVRTDQIGDEEEDVLVCLLVFFHS